VTRNQGTAVGFEFNNATIINGEQSAQLDFRAGTHAKIAEPDFDTASGPFMRVTPALLVRQLHDRSQNAYYLGETTADDQLYDVVGFSMAVGPALNQRRLLPFLPMNTNSSRLVKIYFVSYRKNIDVVCGFKISSWTNERLMTFEIITKYPFRMIIFPVRAFLGKA
jgi:hypothetical protein